MAINFTVSYTFSPSTTISSSQVNTNFSDNSNVWTGLEALTKTFAALRVDATPTNSLDVAIKSYVDKLNNYRRPVLQYASGSVVNIETGINGTSGQAQILFPDGTSRTDSTTGRINCNLAQVAASSGSAQSGLDTGTVSANTWYNFYAIKVTDSSTNFITVASLLSPTQTNLSTLNTRLGANSWVYLGVLPYGDNAGATTAVPIFIMVGNSVSFRNTTVKGANSMCGPVLATTAGATTLTWTYSVGPTISSGNVPSQVLIGDLAYEQTAGTVIFNSGTGGVPIYFYFPSMTSANNQTLISNRDLTIGARSSPGSSVEQTIALAGYKDSILGIGANPFL